MAVVMKAIFDEFNRIVGVQTMDSDDTMEVTDPDGESVAIDVSEALELDTYDFTTTEEIKITTTDETVTEENVGKGVILGHPVHLDIKAVESDVSISGDLFEQANWDGGEW